MGTDSSRCASTPTPRRLASAQRSIVSSPIRRQRRTCSASSENVLPERARAPLLGCSTRATSPRRRPRTEPAIRIVTPTAGRRVPCAQSSPTRATQATRSGTANGVTTTSSTRPRPPMATCGACVGTQQTAGSGRPNRRTNRSSTLMSGSVCRPHATASHERHVDMTRDTCCAAACPLRSLRPTDDGNEPRQRPSLLPLRTPPQPPRSANRPSGRRLRARAAPRRGAGRLARRIVRAWIELPRPHEQSSRPRRTIPLSVRLT